jgi:hypothetical protein
MYYIHNEDGAEQGPYNVEQLADMVHKGEVSRDKLVRSEDSKDLTPLFKVIPEVPLFHLYDKTEAVGPFTLKQLEEKIQRGEIHNHDLVKFQGPNGLNWKPVSDVLKMTGSFAVAPLLTRIPPKPDTHCFVVTGDSRDGPYVQEQIRFMWNTGLITANATVEWENCVKPLPVMVLLQASQQPSSQPSPTVRASEEGTTDIFAIICFATGLAGLLILPLILAPISYVTALISYYRLKENPQLKGKGIRIAGGIFASISILWLLYNFRYANDF